MESTAPFANELTTSAAVGVGIAFLVILLISLTLLSWCLRAASRLCGGEEDGFFRSLLAVFASALLGSGAAALAGALDPETSQQMLTVYGVIGSVLGIAVVMMQNPLRAFGTYIVYSFFAVVSHVAVIGAVALLIVVAVPREKTRQVSEHVPTLASVLGMKSRESFSEWFSAAKPSQVAQETKSETKTVQSTLDDGVEQNPFIQ